MESIHDKLKEDSAKKLEQLNAEQQELFVMQTNIKTHLQDDPQDRAAVLMLEKIDQQFAELMEKQKKLQTAASFINLERRRPWR